MRLGGPDAGQRMNQQLMADYAAADPERGVERTDRNERQSGCLGRFCSKFCSGVRRVCVAVVTCGVSEILRVMEHRAVRAENGGPRVNGNWWEDPNL